MLSPRCQEAYIKYLINDSQTSKLNTYVLLRNLVQRQTSVPEEEGSNWAFKKAQQVKKYGINADEGSDEESQPSETKDTKIGNEELFSFVCSVISEFAVEELRKPEEAALLQYPR